MAGAFASCADIMHAGFAGYGYTFKSIPFRDPSIGWPSVWPIVSLVESASVVGFSVDLLCTLR